MIDLSKSKLFTPWPVPDHDVNIYLLTEKVAPVQQSFYFVNDGMSGDGRFLWIYCAFPPSPTRSLAVVDLEMGLISHFPETQFSDASPYVDARSAAVYWCARDAIWCRSPEGSGAAQMINSLPKDVVRNRTVHRLATHLTRSADGSEFFVDAALGIQWLFGTLPVDGSDFQMWQRFDRNYNHAQFSPSDPDLVLFAEENHSDPITGLRFRIIDRLWLIRRGETARPIFSTPTRVTHEWWDPDGKHAWCVWGNEAWRVDIGSEQVERIEWPSHCWHAHASLNGKCIVADSNEQFYRGCPSLVGFLNRETGRFIELLRNPEKKGITGSQYHVDPHPRFCSEDRFVVFTTTVRGQVDVAMVSTADLIAATS